MTPVFSWTNFRLAVVPEYKDASGKVFKDTITTINYIRTVKDNDSGLSVQNVGQVFLKLPTTETYIPLANLTQTQVAGFVENSLPVSTVDYLLLEELKVVVSNQNLTKPSQNSVDGMVVTPAVSIIRV